jgi:phospholipid/cholesterol/gamma-HCH transport system substrate-binding protein
MRRQRVNPFYSGLVAAIILVVAMVGVVISGLPGGPGIPIPWNHTVSLKVQLRNADALAPHASVDVAGVKVGEVQSIAADGDLAVATLNIDEKYSDIHGDAQVLLRPHGLFGPKYIEISPGTSAAPLLHSGDTITVQQTVQPVDLDQLLQALKAPEAQNLRTAFVELGKAAAGRGDDFNHLLGAATTLTQTLQTPLNTLDSVSPNLSDFIVKNEAFNASFAQTPLDQLVASSNVTLKAFADNAAQLQSLIDHADSTLTTLDSALGGTQDSIRATIRTLPATIDKFTTFNSVLGLFGANLTGKDTSVKGNTDVTAGIISAIENPKSAFSSYDCAITPSPGTTCPENKREYYLRVQVFNLGGSNQLLQNDQLKKLVCNLPPIPGVTCPLAAKSSAGSSPGPDMLAGSYSQLADLIRS